MPPIDHSLAVYGSLAPGKENHHQLADLRGEWLCGHVTGWLVEKGWGADMGYLALIPDTDGARVDVQIFHSSHLPDHWARLDEFEGDGYRRVAISVITADGPVEAWIYVEAGTA